MNIVELLERDAELLVAEATEAVLRDKLSHYEVTGREATKKRVRKLFELLQACIAKQTAAPMVAHSRVIAEERWASGFDLQEVQTAFNVLEEAVWKRILSELEPAEYAQALGRVSTVLGLGKDALARSYVSLATRTRVPSLDLKTLFEGAPAS
ncbi:MAG: hypothetical protein IT453_18335 [Planctomycetes bacterium]|nr:hypothetical protein [Planctomycetota bacterium]